jgi:hypothetical protein
MKTYETLQASSMTYTEAMLKAATLGLAVCGVPACAMRGPCMVLGVLVH